MLLSNEHSINIINGHRFDMKLGAQVNNENASVSKGTRTIENIAFDATNDYEL
jgi:hypothetical protein